MSGGLDVVGRALTGSQAGQRCGLGGVGGPVRSIGSPAKQGSVAGELVHQVLADEVLRVEIGDVELAELRAEAVLQL